MVAVALLCCWTSGAGAAGFALVQQGTAAMGQGNAFVAEANDASAIYYNPAGLNQIKRAQVYQGSFFNFPDRDFSGGGQDSQTNHRMYRSLTAYIAIPVHDRVALGLGFFSPFGMGTAWPPTWAGRYITTYSSLKTYCLNPVVSVKVLDNLSLAAGFDILWSQVQLKRKTPVVLGGRAFPDGEIKLIGDGSGMGYNLGVHYEPWSGLKLGVAYRSKIEVNHSGSLNTTLPVPRPGPNSDGEASIVFPPSLTMGIAYSRLKPFTFEFDTTWTGWSTYDQLKVNLDTPVPVNEVMTNTITTPKNWNNSWAFRFGANYEVNETMKLRAGYIYDLTPVPDSTFDPQVPDANRHIFTVGSDLKVFQRFTLGFAYNYILSESRTKSSSVVVNGVPAPLQANGRYNSDVHSVGLSWSFQF
ncbi:MAG: outer membrane protein transport protein [Deltaproteobacteria bacterium]|nr:outer membrane protein transport protein [Deltaproteobacteria bacterium]